MEPPAPAETAEQRLRAGAMAAGGSLPPAPPREHAAEYVITRTGRALSDAETERDAPAIEVRVLWGRDLLRVDHLAPPRGYFIGDATCDFVVDGEPLGTARFPLIEVEGGRVRVNAPRGAAGMIQTGEKHTTLERAIDEGLAEPHSTLSSVTWIKIDPGMKVTLSLPSAAAPAAYRGAPRAEDAGLARVVVEIASVRAGLAIGREPMLRGEGRMLGSTAFAACLVLGGLGFAAVFMAPIGLDEEGGTSADQAYVMQQHLMAVAEREMEREEAESVQRDYNPPTKTRWELGPRGRWFPDEPALKEMLDGQPFGWLPEMDLAGTMLFCGAFAIPFDDGAAQPRDFALRRDMFCDAPHLTPFGLRALGVPPPPDPLGRDPRDLWIVQYERARSQEAALDTHVLPRPQGRVEIGHVRSASPVAAELVRWVAHRHAGDLRACYELGLTRNHRLQGRIELSIVIGADGAVTTWPWSNNDLHEALVIRCARTALDGTRVPAPGKVVSGFVSVQMTIDAKKPR